ncbi:MAG: hypothetical protein VKJ09_01935 [Leptolyngbya sp.]|nr:hypothetical protein [Leptolyngbya sp.]
MIQTVLALGLSMDIANLPGMGGIFPIAPPLTVSDQRLRSAIATALKAA